MSQRSPITAPPARPPRYSLVQIAEDAQLSPEALAAGWTFNPELCGHSRGGVVQLDCTGDNDPRNPAAHAPIVEGDPFIVWAADECSTFGFQARDWVGRAQRALRASESYHVAKTLWTGGGLGLAQRHLNDVASDGLTGGTGVDVVTALGLVEEGLAYYLRGQSGMVHVTMSFLEHAAAAYAIYRDGNVWRTASGHLVVADAGYDGSAPGGAPATTTQWIYGTSPIAIGLGPVNVLPETFQDAKDQAMALDRTVNNVTVYADRLATWVWDECAHVGAQVAIPVGQVAIGS